MADERKISVPKTEDYWPDVIMKGDGMLVGVAGIHTFSKHISEVPVAAQEMYAECYATSIVALRAQLGLSPIDKSLIKEDYKSLTID